MAYSYKVYPHLRLAHLQYQGTYTTEVGRACTDAYFTSPDFAPDQRQLIDLRDVRTFDADYSALAALIWWKRPYYARLNDDVSHVIVASSDVAFGMGRMYQQMSAAPLGQTFEVVHSMDEALRLLDLTQDALDAGALPDTAPMQRAAKS